MNRPLSGQAHHRKYPSLYIAADNRCASPRYVAIWPKSPAPQSRPPKISLLVHTEFILGMFNVVLSRFSGLMGIEGRPFVLQSNEIPGVYIHISSMSLEAVALSGGLQGCAPLNLTNRTNHQAHQTKLNTISLWLIKEVIRKVRN